MIFWVLNTKGVSWLPEEVLASHAGVREATSLQMSLWYAFWVLLAKICKNWTHWFYHVCQSLWLRVTTQKPLRLFSRPFLLGNVIQFSDNFSTRLKRVALTETLFCFLGAHVPWINFATACPPDLLHAASSQQRNLVRISEVQI